MLAFQGTHFICEDVICNKTKLCLGWSFFSRNEGVVVLDIEFQASWWNFHEHVDFQRNSVSRAGAAVFSCSMAYQKARI